MAYYYYYQQNHTPPDSLVPATTVAQSTPPPLLLLSPLPEQRQLALPLLTSLLPSVTTSMTTSATTEHNQQQQQLPTPNTFIRHCDDMGLFHDLQNIVIMSSLTGPPDNTASTTIPVTTTATMVTTSASTGQHTTSNLFGSSSTAVLTTMMMANPFDETFKQAVLQQQKTLENPTENILNNNNNDGELNTPFIVPTTIIDISRSISNSSLTVTPSVNISTTAVMTASGAIQSMTTTMPQLQHQNVLITTSAGEGTARGMLMVMDEPQQRNSTVTIQPQHQQNNHIFEQQFIAPATTTTANTVGKTTSQDQDYNDNENNEKNGDTLLDVENGTKIKQTLKRNLMVKQMLNGQQRMPLFSEKYHKHIQLQQQNNETDVIVTTSTKQNNKSCNNDNNNDNKDELQKKKQKQELLERNRSAAKRSRMKRKQKWDLISEENRKLKVENSQLRNTVTKLVNQLNNMSSVTTLSSQQLTNCKETVQNTSINDKND